ncbi:MAG: hypothetical protein QOE89_4188 [Pseudonocardiales bacterium]|nr:hypothetical protein [Pseudonocardiales bacterium]
MTADYRVSRPSQPLLNMTHRCDGREAAQRHDLDHVAGLRCFDQQLRTEMHADMTRRVRGAVAPGMKTRSPGLSDSVVATGVPALAWVTV